jgi:DNA-binding response OmpR family regulator
MKECAMRIAIVDDEEETRNFLSALLITHNHSCTTFAGGRDVISAFGRDTFDMLIIDWNMRGMSGVDVIRWVRENVPGRIPIILLTSRSDERDIVEGLQAGADDFIIKPEKSSIIAARVAAVLRRATPDQARPRVEVFGSYVFDTGAGTVELAGEKIDVTAKEYALALTFFRNPHRALSRAYLLETVWNSVADLPTRTMDVHVSRIRTKLKLSRDNGFQIQTIFGFGYRFEVCNGE